MGICEYFFYTLESLYILAIIEIKEDFHE